MKPGDIVYARCVDEGSIVTNVKAIVEEAGNDAYIIVRPIEIINGGHKTIRVGRRTLIYSREILGRSHCPFGRHSDD